MAAASTASAAATDSKATTSAAAAAAAASEAIYRGQCLCKKVKFQVVGAALFSGFCHCSLCQKRGNTDRAVVAGWPKAKFTLTEGKDSVTTYNSSDKTQRFFCKVCGTGLYGEQEHFVGVSPVLFGADDKFRVPKELAPKMHVHYGSSCLLGLIKDGSGLPLYKTTPNPDGSGDQIKE